MTPPAVEAPPPAGPQLAVGAVLSHEGRLLLVRRGRPPGRDFWALPGGRVEPGESLEAAVAREVLEETGLAVEVGQLVGWVERRGRGYHFVILDFAVSLGEPAAGEPELQAGDDAAEARFVAEDELEGLPLVAGLLDWLVEHGLVERRR